MDEHDAYSEATTTAHAIIRDTLMLTGPGDSGTQFRGLIGDYAARVAPVFDQDEAMAVLAGSLASAAAAFFTSSIAKNLGHKPVTR